MLKPWKAHLADKKAFSVRIALGALYIQQYKVLSDRETVEEITENPYLQYFLGLPEFQETAPFDPPMMTHFRKRLGSEIINQVNEWIIMEESEQENQDDNESDDNDDNFPEWGKDPSKPIDTASESKQPENKGKLIMDATCAPANCASFFGDFSDRFLVHSTNEFWLYSELFSSP